MSILRSKDIETSGFNGTAAFMEVRVQSIVVEFILTHVPQLFPEEGDTPQQQTQTFRAAIQKLWTNQSSWITDLFLPYSDASGERRKSLPSPSALPNQDEGFFKGPVPHFGIISPGDGPLAMRPYHAIIEGTDKWVHSFLSVVIMSDQVKDMFNTEVKGALVKLRTYMFAAMINMIDVSLSN